MKTMVLSVPSIFSDGMVFQQQKKNAVWGNGIPSSQVVVTVYRTDKTDMQSTSVDSNGQWLIYLKPEIAGGPFTVTITSSANEAIAIHDVYFGEVWLCSGQSNMELAMETLFELYPEEQSAPLQPMIRQFKIPVHYRFDGQSDDVDGCSWISASPETTGEFSGAAYFFAKELYSRYHIAVGIINASHGGSPVESWIPGQNADRFPALQTRAARFQGTEFCAMLEETALKNLDKWYATTVKNDAGLQNGAEWFLPESAGFVMTSQWRPIEFPCVLTGIQSGLNGEPDSFAGTIWLRREVILPSEFAGATADLWLGTLVDADTTYVNGVAVGSTGYMYPPRRYKVPSGVLHEGKNVIAIRLSVFGSGVCGEAVAGKPYKLFISETAENAGSACIDLQGTWISRIGCSMEPRPHELFLSWEPFCLYNAMIAPFEKFGVRGILWYQGESNIDRNLSLYKDLFTTMVSSWRKNRRQKFLPFIAVQLPGFGIPKKLQYDSLWAELRRQQLQAFIDLPCTGLVPAIDCGEWNDLHPMNKKAIGVRLAYESFRIAYGESSFTMAPLAIRASTIANNPSLIRIVFATGGDDLAGTGGLRDCHIPGLYVGYSGSDLETFVPVSSRIISSAHCVEVDCSSIITTANQKVARQLEIRYCWADFPVDVSIFNTHGIPAFPFVICVQNDRTD